ncbi:MAG: RsmB/NOP family class I SAM-dependent RNA methyltransferase, partial [Alphaproteobacteria bacterium]
ALNALMAVREGRTLDDALTPAMADLSVRDRALAKRLATGTLRSMAILDTKAKAFMKRNFPAKALKARMVLNMGLYQLADSDSPDYAINSTCLNLLGSQRYKVYKPVVDAVLRKVAAERDAWITEFEEGRALWLPRWLKEKWGHDFGENRLNAITSSASNIPVTDLMFGSVERRTAFVEALDGEHPCFELPNGGLRLATGHGPIVKLPFFDEGDWWVQDFAATMPAIVLAEGFDDGLNGKHVLDLCAAPGGKSLQLAALGAKVTAVEISETRAQRLIENVDRCGGGLAGHVRVLVEDALALEEADKYDAILIDAPCGASGTLRRHPEWPYIRDRESHLDNLDIQRKLLEKSAKLLKNNGKIVYSVCSIDPEEGRKQIIGIRPLLQTELFDAFKGTLPNALIHKGTVRTFPDSWASDDTEQNIYQGMDGFFIGRLSLP